jgi:hypothetical protein
MARWRRGTLLHRGSNSRAGNTSLRYDPNPARAGPYAVRRLFADRCVSDKCLDYPEASATPIAVRGRHGELSARTIASVRGKLYLATLVGIAKHAQIRPHPRRGKRHTSSTSRAQPCLLCRRQPSAPHHLRFAQPQALGRKGSDEHTMPLCRSHPQ